VLLSGQGVTRLSEQDVLVLQFPGVGSTSDVRLEVGRRAGRVGRFQIVGPIDRTGPEGVSSGGVASGNDVGCQLMGGRLGLLEPLLSSGSRGLRGVPEDGSGSLSSGSGGRGDGVASLLDGRVGSDRVDRLRGRVDGLVGKGFGLVEEGYSAEKERSAGRVDWRTGVES